MNHMIIEYILISKSSICNNKKLIGITKVNLDV